MELFPLMVLLAVLAQVKPESSCGQSSALKSMSRNFGRIVGGVEVKDCSVIPWQVRLMIERPSGYYPCGGSLISKRHVLTASHCLKDVTYNDQVRVYLADHNQWAHDDSERGIGIKNFTRHPDYKLNDFDSDIAVLTLKESMEPNNPCMKRICMNPNLQFNGQTCIVSGWGYTSSSGNNTALLRMVHVETYDGPKCKRAFDIPSDKYPKYPQKQVCAGVKEGGKDACQGDSGGPLVCWDKRSRSFVQVGVVAYGNGCALEGFPGVYTRVSYFQKWIDQIISENPW